MPHFSRRDLLASTAVALFLIPFRAFGSVVRDALPWVPATAAPPLEATNRPWRYFTSGEAATMEALVDRLIPPDPVTPGGKDVGCAVFIDRQLAGPYGKSEGLYMTAPFQTGTKEQGAQSPLTPAQHYRQALSALDAHCRATLSGNNFSALSDEQKDVVLTRMEAGSIPLAGLDAKAFFALLIKDTQQGFFADPIYGGNKDMAAWKMIGFPGARYDYREWVDRHNERYPFPPVGIKAHPDWAL